MILENRKNDLAKELFDLFKENMHEAVLRFHSSGFKTENYQVSYSRLKNDPFFDLLGYDYNIRFYEIKPKKFLFFKRLSQIGKLTLKPSGKIKNKNIAVEMLIDALDYANRKIDQTGDRKYENNNKRRIQTKNQV